jgi:hypothetical protein
MYCPQHASNALDFQARWVPQIEMLRGLMEEVRDDLTYFDDVIDHDREVDEINVEGYSGFIPTTDGGFDLCMAADMGYGSGSGCLPKIVQPYEERARKDAGDDWLEREAETFGYDPAADYGDEKWGRAWAFINWLEGQDAPPEGQLNLPVDLPHTGPSIYDRARESLYEYEDEGVRATYFYKARAILYSPQNGNNESGKAEVYLIAGVCTDFEYGRDSGTTWVYERTIPLGDLTEELVEQLGRDVRKALADA